MDNFEESTLTNLDITENLLWALVDNLPHPIYVKDTESRFVLCNHHGASAMGVTHPKEAIGKTDFDFYPAEFAEKFQTDDRHVLENGKSLINQEEEIIDAAGQLRCRLTTKVPLFDDQRRVIGLICLSRDITERKKFQQTLEREHNLMRTLMDNQLDFIFVKDKAGNFIINNASHLAALGATCQQDVVGKSSYDFFPPDLADQLRSDDRQVIEQNRPLINRRELVMHPTGIQRWYLTTKVPIHNNQTEVIGLLGISRDITQQKQAEDLLRQAHDELEIRVLERTTELAIANESLQAKIREQQQAEIALRQSERRYKQLLGSVTDYIYTVYIEDNRVARTTHSPNCVAVTGYSHQEYEVNPNLWYQMIYEPDRQAVTAQIGRLLAGETVAPLEHRITHKDGSIRWVRNTTVLRKDQHGNLISYDGLVTDITDRKEAEEALRRSEKRYRLLMENASDGIIIINGNGNILKVNSKIAEMLVCAPDTLIGLNFTELMTPEELQTDPPDINNLLSGETVLKERFLARTDGGQIPVEISAKMIEPDRILAIARDISERKEVEQREMLAYELGLQLATVLNPEILLEKTVNRLKDTLGYYHVHVYLTQTLPDEAGEAEWLIVAEGTGEAGVRLKDQKHAIALHAAKSLVAQAARRQKPVVVNDVAQSPDHLPNPLLPDTRAEVALPLFAGQQLIGVLDVQHNQADHFDLNEVRTLEIVANQLSVALANAQLFQEQQRLLEQVKAGQDRLQHLSHRLVEVQEAERRHIARELHDEVGQLLTGLKLTLEMSQRLPPPDIKSSLEEPQSLVNELIKQVRELSLELRPAMLDDLGLLPTLQWHIERYTAKTNIQVQINTCTLNNRLPSAIETAAYRIIQEALTNVARHTNVGEAAVSIWQEDENLYIQVEDEGTGFDIKTNQTIGKFSGLSGMQERAVLLGGNLAIDTTPGNGTCITARLPLTIADRGKA